MLPRLEAESQLLWRALYRFTGSPTQFGYAVADSRHLFKRARLSVVHTARCVR